MLLTGGGWPLKDRRVHWGGGVKSNPKQEMGRVNLALLRAKNGGG